MGASFAFSFDFIAPTWLRNIAKYQFVYRQLRKNDFRFFFYCRAIKWLFKIFFKHAFFKNYLHSERVWQRYSIWQLRLQHLAELTERGKSRKSILSFLSMELSAKKMHFSLNFSTLVEIPPVLISIIIFANAWML